MSEIGKWIFYSIPWPAQVALIALPCLIILVALINVLGFERVKGWIVPVIGLLAAIGLLSSARQQGYNDRRDIQKKKQDEALDDFRKVEQQVDAKPISEVDKENGKWLRD